MQRAAFLYDIGHCKAVANDVKVSESERQRNHYPIQ